MSGMDVSVCGGLQLLPEALTLTELLGMLLSQGETAQGAEISIVGLAVEECAVAAHFTHLVHGPSLALEDDSGTNFALALTPPCPDGRSR